MSSPKNTTTLREVMKNYLPETDTREPHANVAVNVMRQLASQIREANSDILDTSFDADKVHEIGKGLYEYVMGDLATAVDQATRAANEEDRAVTEADVVRILPDNIGRKLAEDVRNRVYEAVTSSTTDSM